MYVAPEAGGVPDTGSQMSAAAAGGSSSEMASTIPASEPFIPSPLVRPARSLSIGEGWSSGRRGGRPTIFHNGLRICSDCPLRPTDGGHMKGKLAVVVSLATVLATAGPVAADDGHRDITLDPGKVLMEVKVPTQRLYDELYPSYDFVEALQRNGDGSISTDVLVNDEERALLQARGVQFVRTLETAATTEARVDERDAAQTREARAQALAEGGSAARSQSAIPQPGEVTVMRAYTFTNYAGRFLYVEAHTKAATPVTANNVVASPTMALSSAGADGVFGAASNMPIFRDNMTGINNNNVYMYHRHLVRVTDVEPRRVRVASSAGGVDEAP